jgi:hypothetical protein
MDAWADGGVEPPASSYPRLEDGTLIAVDEARAAFPAIPGLRFPASANALERLDYGPEFNRYGGVITTLPPLATGRYPVLVPRADRDGFDVAGIRLVQLRAPLGTTTGWNVRTATARSTDLCGLSGSYVPFARTTAERAAANDSRNSSKRSNGRRGSSSTIDSSTPRTLNATSPPPRRPIYSGNDEDRYGQQTSHLVGDERCDCGGRLDAGRSEPFGSADTVGHTGSARGLVVRHRQRRSNGRRGSPRSSSRRPKSKRSSATR